VKAIRRPRKKRLIRLADTEGDKSSRIEDLYLLRKRMTDPLLAHLLRALLWVDRLFVLVMAWQHISSAADSWSPDARTRKMDSLSLLYFMCGTLREMTIALRESEEAGLASLLADDELHYLEEARQMMERWDSNTVYVMVRNKGGFHIDADVIEKGIAQMQARANRHVFYRGKTNKRRDNRFTFAHDVLLSGLFPGNEGMDKIHAFLEQVGKDSTRIDKITEALFVFAQSGTERGLVPKPLPRKQEPEGSREKLEVATQALQRLRSRYGLPVKADATLPEQIDAIADELLEQRRRANEAEKRFVKTSRGVARARTP
jgi:hypothetical protein